MIVRTALTSLLILTAACAGKPVETTGSADLASTPAMFEWPVPAGWGKETIAFPIPFAPSLRYEGVEELRFAPGFFEAASPGYFTYSLAFVIDTLPFTTERFASDLLQYFTGLMAAVGQTAPDPARHKVSLASDDPSHFHGAVATYDAFGDGRQLALDLEGETFLCGNRRVIVASVSPRSRATDPIWKDLATMRASFHCLAN